MGSKCSWVFRELNEYGGENGARARFGVMVGSGLYEGIGGGWSCIGCCRCVCRKSELGVGSDVLCRAVGELKRPSGWELRWAIFRSTCFLRAAVEEDLRL